MNDGFIKSLLKRVSSLYADSVAVSAYKGEEIIHISYSQLTEDILIAAGAFRDMGIKGKHIAIAGMNSYRWIVAFFAVLASGNVAVLFNPDLADDDIRQAVSDTDTDIICADEIYSRKLAGIFGGRTVQFDELFGGAPIELGDVYAADDDETILLQCSSGTTGKSKVVECSSDNILSTCEKYIGKVLEITRESSMQVLPFYHVAALQTIIRCLWAETHIFIGRGAKYLLSDMPAFDPEMVTLVPSIMDGILSLVKKTNTPEKIIGKNLKKIFCVGAAINPAALAEWHRYGVSLMVGYAMTETRGVGTIHNVDEEHVRSIGCPEYGIEARFEDGELLFRGRPVMKGYYKDSEETAKVIENGWLHTGDLGYCKDGYYYLTGRKKNVIILANGENVNPEELEMRLCSSEHIEECLVYGENNMICADVYANDKEEAEKFIKSFNSSSPTYKRINKINFVQEPLEKTGSGKIKRK